MNDFTKTSERKSGPLIATGTLIGLGMGGFVDGILLHQILQWHQMISNKLPPNTLINKEINMFWDGIFHVFTWTITATGIALLWSLRSRKDVVHSAAIWKGALIFGWGLFNLIDSVANHYIFAFHNLKENSENPQLWNHGFTLLAILMMLIGWQIILKGKKEIMLQ